MSDITWAFEIQEEEEGGTFELVGGSVRWASGLPDRAAALRAAEEIARDYDRELKDAARALEQAQAAYTEGQEALTEILAAVRALREAEERT
jgi:hypothetical protein